MTSLIIDSHWHRMVWYATLIICFAPEWIGTFFQRPEKAATRRDRGSHVLLFLCITAGIFAAIYCMNAWPAAALTWHQSLLFWTGIGLMFAGLAFRWYSIRVLGKFFTRDVATRPDQPVVEAGPYRWIRHPSYSGSFVMFLGTGLAMTNWASLLALLLGALLGFSYRVYVEEQALCKDLGDPYRTYMQHTRRFIPHVW